MWSLAVQGHSVQIAPDQRIEVAHLGFDVLFVG